jgi:hypothetical protein
MEFVYHYIVLLMQSKIFTDGENNMVWFPSKLIWKHIYKHNIRLKITIPIIIHKNNIPVLSGNTFLESGSQPLRTDGSVTVASCLESHGQRLNQSSRSFTNER